MDSLNWRERRQAEGEDSSAPPRQREPNLRYSERPRYRDLDVHRPSPQRDDPAAAEAIAEGKRVYLGNLNYNAKPQDVEEFLTAHQFGAPDKIHISVDPISGRNPGYCFVEFADRETAERAISTLDGQDFWGREAKCRPCLPKGDNRGSRNRQREAPSGTGFNRWGDWGRGGNAQDRDAGGARGGPEEAQRYFESSVSDGKQLYVGGLPRMLDQAMNEQEMREIFQGFEVDVVGKRISPKNAYDPGSERRNFCFVDFSSPEQAKAALEAVNGTEYRGAPIKVSVAHRGGSSFNSRPPRAE